MTTAVVAAAGHSSNGMKFLFCGFNGSVKTTFSKIWDDRKSKIFIFVEIYFSQLGKVSKLLMVKSGHTE